MREVAVEEGLDASVEGFHDGQVGTLASDVQYEVNEHKRNAEQFISIPFQRWQIQFERFPLHWHLLLRRHLELRHSLLNNGFFNLDELLLKNHVILLHSNRQQDDQPYPCV